jgi:hypothetical protein
MINNIGRYKYGLFLCVLGFAATFIAFYPGFMSWDSVNQYEQALSGEYNDWQPPVMALLWSALNKIYCGPEPMLAFHLALYWGGFFILYAAYKRRGSRLAIYFPVAAFSPCLLNTVGVIWKDVGLAVSWLFCISLLVYLHTNRIRMGLISASAIFASFVYGYLVRHNSLTSAPFMLLMIFYVLFNGINAKHPRKWPVIIGISMVAFFGMNLLADTFNKTVSRQTFPKQYVMLDDLSAIYRDTAKDYFPGYIRDKDRFSDFIKDVGKIEIGALFYPTNSYYATTNRGEYHDLRSGWTKAIRENPWSYISYRSKVFFKLYLGFNYDTANSAYFSIIPNKHGIVFRPTRLFMLYASLVYRAIKWLPIVFKPAFWFFFLIALLIACLSLEYFRSDVIIVGLWSVSFSYFIGYLAYLPVFDFRFIYLSMVVSTVLLGVVINNVIIGKDCDHRATTLNADSEVP